MGTGVPTSTHTDKTPGVDQDKGHSTTCQHSLQKAIYFCVPLHVLVTVAVGSSLVKVSGYSPMYRVSSQVGCRGVQTLIAAAAQSPRCPEGAQASRGAGTCLLSQGSSADLWLPALHENLCIACVCACVLVKKNTNKVTC